MKKCPICSKTHRKFPRKCYESARDDHLHAVIARLASLGSSDQQAWSQRAQAVWDEMCLLYSNLEPQCKSKE